MTHCAFALQNREALSRVAELLKQNERLNRLLVSEVYSLQALVNLDALAHIIAGTGNLSLNVLCRLRRRGRWSMGSNKS